MRHNENSPALRRRRTAELPGVSGVVRLDRRTKNLTKRLRPGDIAVIDHVDLDRVSAEALVACRVGAVVNVAPIDQRALPQPRPGDPGRGRHPAGRRRRAGGAGRSVQRGRAGPARRRHALPRGDEHSDRQGQATRTAETGRRRWTRRARACPPSSRRSRPTRWSTSGASATCCSTASACPTSETPIDGRHVLIVVRGLRLQGGPRRAAAVHPRVPAGADRRRRRRGRAGRGGLHAGPDRRRHGLGVRRRAALRRRARRARLPRRPRARAWTACSELGLRRRSSFPAAGTSEDVAMLLADDKGAALIVAVGTHATLVEFLDKGRAGMASTFLTRLRVGGKLVDAKGVSRLYRSRICDLQVLAADRGRAVRARRRARRDRRGRRALADPAGTWSDFFFWVRGRLYVIDFRYHMVSIVAVFFALGAGVLLGAGPLEGPTRQDVVTGAGRARTGRRLRTPVRTDTGQSLDKHRDDVRDRGAPPARPTAAAEGTAASRSCGCPTPSDSLVDEREQGARGGRRPDHHRRPARRRAASRPEQRPMLGPAGQPAGDRGRDRSRGQHDGTTGPAGSWPGHRREVRRGQSVDDDADQGDQPARPGRSCMGVEADPEGPGHAGRRAWPGTPPAPAPDDNTDADDGRPDRGSWTTGSAVVVCGHRRRRRRTAWIADGDAGRLRRHRDRLDSVDVADLPSRTRDRGVRAGRAGRGQGRPVRRRGRQGRCRAAPRYRPPSLTAMGLGRLARRGHLRRGNQRYCARAADRLPRAAASRSDGPTTAASRSRCSRARLDGRGRAVGALADRLPPAGTSGRRRCGRRVGRRRGATTTCAGPTQAKGFRGHSARCAGAR